MSPTPSPSLPPAPTAGNILVVDDTPANLRLLVSLLTEQGYKVRPASSGPLALMGAQAAPPDLILLDISMPDMNGYQVCEALKADPCTRDIPIIFISALDQTEDKVQAFVLGGVDYITKPFQFEEVLARVRTHLTLHHLQRQLVTANQELQAANQELAAANQALAQANAELAASNADLDAFAHTVAHDLKNPLTTIIGFSRLLESRLSHFSPTALQENLQRITQTGYKMQEIIHALLLFASVRQEGQPIEAGPCPMGTIVQEALQRFELQIQEQQAEVITPPDWPVATGQPAWVEEVWANYISNALKYGGHPPCVELGATVTGTAIRFWVRDNGPGLTPEEQAQVFAPFTRFHQTKADGHGLGLSIVQRIVERLGGSVGVECPGIGGTGSTFWFTLPAASPELPPIYYGQVAGTA